MTSSGVTGILPPKPPPTSGAMTRTLCSGMPSVSASMIRRMCGIWVADHIVICSPVGSTTVERGSMNAGISRCWRSCRSMTIAVTASPRSPSSTSPPVPAAPESKTQVEDLFVPRSGWTRSAPSSAAAPMSRTGGQRARSRRRPARRRPAPRPACRATTTATVSPAWLTWSTASDGCAGCLHVRGDRPRARQVALLVGEVRAGEDGDDAGAALGLGGVDRGDRGVRDRAAQDREVQHAGQGDVVGPAWCGR